MEKEKLLELLSLGESNNIELKNEFDSYDICESVCSFLNTKGGFVVCGLTNSPTKERIERWKQEIEERIAAVFIRIHRFLYQYLPLPISRF